MREAWEWVEDGQAEPHRVLEGPEPRPRHDLADTSASVLAEVDGRPVLVLTGRGWQDEQLIGGVDLETGAYLPDRSGLLRAAPRSVLLGGGRWLVTQSERGDVLVRDAVTGAPLHELRDPDGPVTGLIGFATVNGRDLVFAAGRDIAAWDVATGDIVHRRPGSGSHFAVFRGRMLVATQRDGETRFHDALTGEAFGAPGPGGPMTTAEYEGRLIVASRRDNYGTDPVVVWDAGTGEEVLVAPPSLGNDKHWLSYTMKVVGGCPLLLLGRQGKPVLLWDLAAGRAVDFPMGEEERDIDQLALGSDGDEPAALLVWKSGAAELVTRGRRVPLSGPGPRIVAFGEVGGRPAFVLADELGVLRLIDVATGEDLPSMFYGGQVRNDPLAVRRELVVLGGTPPRVWDLSTGLPIAKAGGLESLDRRVTLGELDGRTVLAAADDVALTVRDVATGELLTEIPAGPLGLDKDCRLVFTEIGGRVAVTAVSERATLRSWDARTGADAGRPYTLDRSLAVLGTGRGGTLVLLGGYSGDIRVVDPATGEEAGLPPEGHHDQVRALAHGTVDGRDVVVSGSADQTVRVWDAATGAPIGMPFKGHDAAVDSVHFLDRHGEPAVISTAEQGPPRMWMLGSPAADGGHYGAVTDVAAGFRDGVPVFASASDDTTVRLWYATTGALAGPPLIGHDTSVTAVAFAGPGHDVLVSADADGLVLRDGQPLARLDSTVVSLATAEVDGRHLVGAATEDGTLRIWDIRTQQPYATLSTDELKAAALTTRDGRLLAATITPHDDDGLVTVWDVLAGEPVYEPVAVPEAADTSLAFGFVDGRLVVVHGIDAEGDEDEGYHPEEESYLAVYDTGSRTQLIRLEHECAFPSGITVAPGSIVLIGTDNGGVRAMDARTGEETLAYEHHNGYVSSVATTEVDGHVIVASGDGANTVHIWDLATGTRR
ncbi:WD40 repeat domain-containing protein [Symbioplanes lichenis]|uniref:WD40 repeat domain-containing protein n=1 Tax=Symbioplanes lichenis TaxID=1629072 RepID=UPI00273929C5|nr:WD40 repeat domain-containing protein [Actinoplanes lichenis]